MGTNEGLASTGHVIFITGVPSSGKSTVASRFVARSASFEVLSGDAAIRELNAEAQDSARGLFRRLLDRVEARAADGNVIVDMTLPEIYVREARERFSERALFVGLRLSEAERVAREQSRTDRDPVPWSAALSSLHGPDSLYDLNIDSSKTPPEEAADSIASLARKHWPELD